MSLNVTIPPKVAARDAATSAQTKSSPTDALVVHLYCDGSYKHGSSVRRLRPQAGVGIVANIWLPRNTTKQRTSKACYIPCDSDDDNTTIEAFALAEGAQVALDQISRIEDRSPIRSTDGIEVILWSDSATVLLALENQARFRTQSKKSRHLLDIIKLKTYELQGLRADVSVHFQWCPRNCVEPHATADHLSKKVRISGGSTPSKVMEVFKSGPHSSIEEKLRRKEVSVASPTSPSSTLATTAASTNNAATTFLQNGGDGAQSSSSNTDLYSYIEIAAQELPVQQKDVILAAIELQKKVNLARAQDGIQGQASAPEAQAAESDDHLDKPDGLDQLNFQGVESDDGYDRIEGQLGQVSGYDDHVHENDGQPRELEDQIYESDGHSNGNVRIGEPESGEDGDVDDCDFDDDVENIDQARSNRMHNMWAWVERKLPRL